MKSFCFEHTSVARQHLNEKRDTWTKNCNTKDSDSRNVQCNVYKSKARPSYYSSLPHIICLYLLSRYFS